MEHRDPDDPSHADRREGLASLLDDRVVHLHVGDLEHPAGRRGGALQVARLAHRHAQRLLDEDVLSGLQRAEDLRRVVARGQEQDRVHVGVVADGAPVGRARHSAGKVRGHAPRQRRREIADVRHLEAVAKGQQVRQVNGLPDQAEADDAEPNRLIHNHRTPSETILGRSTRVPIGTTPSPPVVEWDSAHPPSVWYRLQPTVSQSSRVVKPVVQVRLIGRAWSAPSALGTGLSGPRCCPIRVREGAHRRRTPTAGEPGAVNAPGRSSLERRGARAEPGRP